jgi:uridine kinase
MPRGPSGDRGPEAAAGRVIGAVARWRAAGTSPPGVIILAIDGHGAAGKSTIADAVAEATGATLVHTDDFFRALPVAALGPGGAGGAGGAEDRPPPGRRALADYYDWRRLRAQALEPLRARRGAAFRRFDWERGSGLDGTVTVAPSDLILVEGVYSAAPELRDLVDRSVFVDTPEHERLRRLRGRVRPEEWDDEWLIAEHAYFDVTRPPSAFDLTVSGTGPPPALARR